MKIDAGKLDRRLTVLAETVTQNELGEQVRQWAIVATIYAQRLELRQSDVARAAGRDTQASAKYLVRYRNDICVGQRLSVDGATYQIVATDEPDRRTTLVLTVAGV